MVTLAAGGAVGLAVTGLTPARMGPDLGPAALLGGSLSEEPIDEGAMPTWTPLILMVCGTLEFCVQMALSHHLGCVQTPSLGPSSRGWTLHVAGVPLSGFKVAVCGGEDRTQMCKVGPFI